MNGYRELARSARTQRDRLLVRQLRLLSLVDRIRERLRDPKLLAPSFLAGLATGILLPRATGSLRTLVRATRLIKLVGLPLLALYRQQSLADAEPDHPGPERPLYPEGNHSMDDRLDAYWQTLETNDHTRIHYRYWAAGATPHAVLQLVHGAAEHSGRYQRFAQALVDSGYAVYAADHRGHGRSRVRSGELGDAGPDAWNAFVEDQAALSRHIRRAHPETPLVMFGHSMGSFIAQDFISRYPAQLNGLILSGTAYTPPPPPEVIEAARQAAVEAPLAPSEIWAGMFAEFNRAFSEQPGFDWLSRDAEEVRQYLEDPLCGFLFNNALVHDFFQGIAALRTPAREADMPPDLPILVVQGALDPVGGNLESTRALLDRFAELGMTRVEHRFYPDARHELLNETNRSQVQQDILHWLERQLPAGG
ncbi:MAG: lysophospholipase [Ectothiorhodospiraceae bacterium]|nr:lysophospholipase [Ectothiorhodospiraceae bacterium]